jgi:hypothetical protein
MNEKIHKLNLSFDETLRRLAQTPKTAIDAVESKPEPPKSVKDSRRDGAHKPPRRPASA